MIRGIVSSAVRTALHSAALMCAATLPILATAAPMVSRADRELEQRLLAHIKVLASDDFEGRKPGTEGEAKTLRYLGKEWFDIGLVSGTNDPSHEWFAPVTLIAREPSGYTAQFTGNGRRLGLARDQIVVLTSGTRSLLREAPLLFIGKGSGAELSRNELAGRVAVLLDGDAPSEGPDVSLRQNQLLAQGASAVLTVLDGKRTLAQVRAHRQRTGYALEQDTTGGDLEAFITSEAMANLMRGAGGSLKGLTQAAAEPGFAPVPLDLSVTLEATTRETTIRTHNLIGKLPGRHSEAGAVLLLSHWDHFGICGAPPATDLICNGAVDNASGVAALTEIARRLSRGPQMERDVYFMATTAEEVGLIGAHAFTENPPLPPEQIVAAFNIDSVAIAPKGTPFAIVGRGMTNLDSQIEQVAKAERLRIVPGDEANEFVKRQDGWALLQHDIPAVMVTTAYGKVDLMRAFFEGRYHHPDDDLSRPIELGGAADDVRMLTALTRHFADPRKVPRKIK
ncbi:hypothetical protein GGR39_002647 [Novosphingobium fluoreni]|uniref:Peptidase M28 domain-containing protein n=1 Tax=Novosphingobium fluoreni TaxID=1391222 RepID=A0A7W6BZY0_9SPHN|nr:M28 family peptidase [Novosphingobium fluoreni]MBB3940984.1 hypothetical protein [Novosphingobium fluoreni]